MILSLLKTTPGYSDNEMGKATARQVIDKFGNTFAETEPIDKEIKRKRKQLIKRQNHLKKIDNKKKDLVGVEAEMFNQVYVDGLDITTVINNIIEGKVSDSTATGSSATLWRIWKRIKL